ncbi:MAG: hypothetical protein WDA16_03480, partial [Candidatus Thermoplasmatota archaeon]
FVDCWDDEIVTTTINTVATGPLSPLSFADHPREQWNSSSLLNQRNPWGLPEDSSYVVITDCSSPVIAQQKVQTFHFSVRAPKVPPTVSMSGSASGTVSTIGNGFDDCDRTTDKSGNQWERQAASVPYSAETGGLLFLPDSKITTDFVLQYNEGLRPPVTAAAFGSSGAKDGGLSDAGNSDGLWLATGTISEDHNPFVNRAALRETKPIQEVQYITTYAFISPTGVSAYGLLLNPASKSGTYGIEACGTHNTGVYNGWNCNPNEWWPGAACDAGYGCTSQIEGQTTTVNVRLGQAYNERDVDCYDTSVTAARGAGVGWGLLTGTACV